MCHVRLAVLKAAAIATQEGLGGPVGLSATQGTRAPSRLAARIHVLWMQLSLGATTAERGEPALHNKYPARPKIKIN